MYKSKRNDRIKQKDVMLFILISSILFGFLVIGLYYSNNSIGNDEGKKVLYISSFNNNYINELHQISGLRSVLNKKDIQLDLEFMDSLRFNEKENITFFYKRLRYKLENIEPYDAIVVGGDKALQFVTDYQEELFKGVPIVFLGVKNVINAKEANENKYATGIIESSSIKENIQVGITLNDSATKVIAILDESVGGITAKEQFYLMEPQFKQLRFQDINVSEYTFKELEGRLEEIDNDTIILFLMMIKDKEGTSISYRNGMKLLREHTNVPIYTTTIAGIGDGMLGGKVVYYEEAGKIAAQMVVNIFKGTPIESIKMINKSPNRYLFDYNVMEKYKIDQTRIPANSIFLNKKLSFYEEHQRFVLGTSFIMFLFIVLLCVLIVDNVVRRRIDKQLKKNHARLEVAWEDLSASEEELRAQYETIQEHVKIIELLNQKFEVAIESTNSAVWEIDNKNKELSISLNFETMIGKKISNKKNVFLVLNDLLTPQDKELLIEEYESYKSNMKSEINIQLPLHSENKKTKWFLVRGKGFFDANEELLMIHGILVDITKLKEQEESINHLIQHDYLTSLPNRMVFMDKLREEIKRDRTGAIILLDFDDFKRMNDTLGHVYGDMAIIEIANRLSKIADEKLFVARFGEDEFLFLVLDVQTKEEIKSYVYKIREVFNKLIVINNIENHINFSMGISSFPLDSRDPDQLIMNADTAMYKVKRSGKNSYMFYANNMQDELKEKIEIETILREALKEDGYTLLYQPQIDLKTGEIHGFEALIRLKNHTISPMKFIPIAEETGLILAIGRWVTVEVIKQLAKWRERGFLLKSIAVNFSSKQLRDLEYFNFLQETLEEYKVDAQYFEIEITESILLEKSFKTLEFLNKLKSIGIQIALDDFGTGYSSLNYLTFIPVDKIKLDKSLSDKFLKMENIKVMDSLIVLAHSLNLKITAEGIEELEQYKRLEKGGCNFIQGYFFSKPLKIKDVEAVYHKNFLLDL